MMKNYQTKVMTPETGESQSGKEKYHFPGEGEYKPITIEAESLEEAEKEYEVKKEKVN